MKNLNDFCKKVEKGVDPHLSSSPLYIMVSCMVITSVSGHQAPDTTKHQR